MLIENLYFPKSRSKMLLKNEKEGYWCYTLLKNITSDIRYKPRGKTGIFV